MTYDISCSLLMKALHYYNMNGYTPTDAPLVVDNSIIEATSPNVGKQHGDSELYYVGSAEQSFLQLISDGKVNDNNLMMVTPCQRYDDIDYTHLEIFLKVELISLNHSYIDIMNTVIDFYITQGIIGNVLKVSDTQNDLMVNGLEVGSFGSRTFNGIKYSYGTGLALPRITQALSV